MLVHNENKEKILVLASGNAGKAREFAKLLEPLGYTGILSSLDLKVGENYKKNLMLTLLKKTVCLLLKMR